MTLGIMQPYFMPYIGYWQLLNYVDEYVIYNDVNFIKRGWINRNYIIVNGEPHLFTLKLNGSSQNKKINEIFISDDFIKFHKSLELSYKKSPFFNKTMILIDEIINFKERRLDLFIANSIFKIVKHLDINTKLHLSSCINKDETLKGQDKIIDICQRLGAKRYINAIGGKELYSKDAFSANCIDLKFLQPEVIQYKQNTREFHGGLSLIDVLMSCSTEQIHDMLSHFSLVSL